MKTYRVWYKIGTAVIVKAENLKAAQEQAEKMYEHADEKFIPHRRKMVKSAECLSK